jgi:hypothetical protein
MLSHWATGHCRNNSMNNNGTESSNKVVKEKVTIHQQIPAIIFAKKIADWMGYNSRRRDPANANYIEFSFTHTFITKDWTKAFAFKNNKRVQMRLVDGIYVLLSPYTNGHLDDEKARKIIKRFENLEFKDYLEYTIDLHNAFVLHEDASRPEGYRCTCPINAKEFTCEHSLAVANIRGNILPPEAAQVKLLGQKRKRGRRPQVAGAWAFQQLDIASPVAHPPQDAAILAGAQIEEVALNLGEDLA